MSIEIIQKKKTEPSCPSHHKCLVPLRVVGFTHVTDREKDALDKQVEIGDVIFSMSASWLNFGGLFNCSKGKLIDTRLNENIRCVRAYDVKQVVLSNDDEPAPIL